MKSSRVTFSKLPDTFNNLRVLGSLIFDKRDELGGAGYLDLTEGNQYMPLKRDLIASLYELASPANISSGHSIGTYKNVIHYILHYAQKKGFDQEFRLKDMDYEFLINIRVEVQLEFGSYKSTTMRRKFGNMLRLFAAAQAIGLANDSAVAPSNFRWANDEDRTQPYSSGELIDLEAVCRTQVRECLARLAKGRELLAIGSNPQGAIPARDAATGQILKMLVQDRPWNKLENLIWYVTNKMDGLYLKRKELISLGHSSFNNSVMGVWHGVHRKIDVYSHIYVLSTDLIPFVILLALKTGRNESSVYDLERDCIRELDGRFYLEYTKLRGSEKRYRKPIDADGQFSPVELIRKLIEITAPLVRFVSPEEKNKLFLGLTIHTGSDSFKSLDTSYHKYQMNCEDGWCDQTNLIAENGGRFQISMRRLRVSYLTKRYRRTGQLGRVSHDARHRQLTTTVPYIDNDGTRHLHERAIQAGIQKARNVVRPTVVPDSDFLAVSAAIGVTPDVAKAVLIGEQDVMFSSCKDFYNRPGGVPNVPCDSPWQCLGCSNSIITKHVLPRIIAFKRFMERQRTITTEIDWSAKFMAAYRLVNEHILPKFSDTTLAEATSLADSENFYLPISWEYKP